MASMVPLTRLESGGSNPSWGRISSAASVSGDPYERVYIPLSESNPDVLMSLRRASRSEAHRRRRASLVR